MLFLVKRAWYFDCLFAELTSPLSVEKLRNASRKKSNGKNVKMVKLFKAFMEQFGKSSVESSGFYGVSFLGKLCRLVTLVFYLVAYANPLEVIESGLKNVIEVNEKYTKSGKSMTPEHLKELSDLAEKYINFAEMARRSFGAMWNDMNDDQRQEAVALMKSVLINSYIDKVARVKHGQVKVMSEIVSGDRADVLSRVEDKQGPVQIDYRLRKNGDAWMVVDVVIEKVSLVANYRQEFAAISRSEGIPGVIKALKKKLESKDQKGSGV